MCILFLLLSGPCFVIALAYGLVRDRLRKEAVIFDRFIMEVNEMKGATSTYDSNSTIEDAIFILSREGGWICPDCWNYGDGVHCKANIFIAFVGAYMEGCWAFDDKPRTRREVLRNK